jgi:hypothetical protein
MKYPAIAAIAPCSVCPDSAGNGNDRIFGAWSLDRGNEP